MIAIDSFFRATVATCRDIQTLLSIKKRFPKAAVTTSAAALFVFSTLASAVANEASDDGAEEMVLIPAGSFTMGSPTDEAGRLPDETLHKVSLSRPFYLGRAEVTSSLWHKVRDWGLENGYTDLGKGYNGFSGPENATHPVTNVTWWDAIYWCNARSEMEGRKPVYYSRSDFGSSSVIRAGMPMVHANWKANGYRLPTEAEWEYACRAGSVSAFSSGDIQIGEHRCLYDPNLHEVGWYCGNSEKDTHVPGRKAANDFGLVDMHGNVFEWCWDWYGPYEQKRESRNPTGPEVGTQRLMRGGSWMNTPPQARSAYRQALAPATVFYTMGFRVATSE